MDEEMDETSLEDATSHPGMLTLKDLQKRGLKMGGRRGLPMAGVASETSVPIAVAMDCL